MNRQFYRFDTDQVERKMKIELPIRSVKRIDIALTDMVASPTKPK